MKSFFHFFFAALKNPLQVSTLFETGPVVAQIMVNSVEVNPSSPVVELGVGTGAITQVLLKHLASAKAYVGVELNADLIEYSQKRFPDTNFYEDSAVNFPRYLGGAKASAVVSSLPWTVMPKGTMSEILQSVFENLSDQGVFTTYLTAHVLGTPAGRRFQEQLHSQFSNVESHMVLANLPPAKVFVARK